MKPTKLIRQLAQNSFTQTQQNSFVQTEENTGNLGTFQAPSSAFAPSTGAEAASTLDRILSIALGGVTLVAAVYFLIVMALAAFDWISSNGDTSKIEKARNSILNGLVGLVILVAVYAVAGVIGSLVGIDILNPGQLILQLGPSKDDETKNTFEEVEVENTFEEVN